MPISKQILICFQNELARLENRVKRLEHRWPDSREWLASACRMYQMRWVMKVLEGMMDDDK